MRDSATAPVGGTRAPSVDQPVHLRRTVGLLDGCSIIIGIIVGSGIFVSPQGVVRDTGSVGAALAVWIICGVMSMLGALCFAELGTSISSSGGDYSYIRLAYGELASFLYLWMTFVVILPCSSAISALTFAKYLLKPMYPDCEPPEQSIQLVALAILLLIVFVNCVSIEGSIKVQGCFTLAKILALLLVIAAGFYYIVTDTFQPHLNIAKPKEFWANTETSIPRLVQAFYSGFYTYAGWNSLNFITEEMKDPVRNMPRAIVLSMTLVTLIYVLANVAYFAVLTIPEILSSEAIAVQFGLRAFSWAPWLMPLAVALSAMGGLNGHIFAASRILLTGAQQGQLCSALSMINVNYMSPIASIITLGIMSALYLIKTGILDLINYLIPVEACFAALAVSTVLTLRHKRPDLARPLRVPVLVPLIYLLASFILVVLPIWNSPWDALIGLTILLAGVPIYYATANWQKKPASYQQSIDWLNSIVQKLTNSVMQDSVTPPASPAVGHTRSH